MDKEKNMSSKVAVILSGCGYLDGAEIRESVLSLLCLDKLNCEVSIFAPDRNQYHVINHCKGEEASGERNILQEAGRIARGKISPLTELSSSNFDALVIPGGFGVAKNLSTLAFDGPQGKIDSTFQAILEDFYNEGKPIGAICIAPAVICLALGKHGISVTIGNDSSTAEAIEALGAKHISCEVDEIHVDEEHKIISTPAYMYDGAPISGVASGIEKCISKVLEMRK